MIDTSALDALDKAFNDKIQFLLKRMLEEGEKLVPETKDNIYLEFGEYQQRQITDIFTDAVRGFYNSYDPFFYNRNESLYNVLDMKPDMYGMLPYVPTEQSLFTPNVTPFERGGGAQGLYERVFKQGYHGGATGTDHNGDTREVPSYRTPYPGYAENAEKYGSTGGYFRWGRTAVQSEAPYDVIMREIAAKNPEMDKEFERIAIKHCERLAERWQERTDRLVDEIFNDWRW